MAGKSPTTLTGYNMFEISSLLQKAIRRCDVRMASFAAKELKTDYRGYLWKRLLVVSAEDCYGVVTKEIIALEQADEYCNKNKGKNDKTNIFLAKAVLLLCHARKNRDADYVCCNFFGHVSTEEIDPRIDKLTDEEYERLLDEVNYNGSLPGYVYDCHTYIGKARGKTKLDMIRAEQEALKPHQMCLFDDASWGGYYQKRMDEGALTPREQSRWQGFMDGKELDPTHWGEDFPEN